MSTTRPRGPPRRHPRARAPRWRHVRTPRRRTRDRRAGHRRARRTAHRRPRAANRCGRCESRRRRRRPPRRRPRARPRRASGASSCLRSRGDRGSGDLAIVERQHGAAHLLIRLVALAGDHDEDRRRGPRRPRARSPIARSGSIRCGASTGIPRTISSMIARRVLRSRVVARHDGEIGVFRRDASHDRSLRPVAVSAATEHNDHPASGQRTCTPEHAEDAIRRVCVIHYHREPLTCIDGLHPPGHERGPNRSPGRGRHRRSRGRAGSEDPEAVAALKRPRSALRTATPSTTNDEPS